MRNCIIHYRYGAGLVLPAIMKRIRPIVKTTILAGLVLALSYAVASRGTGGPGHLADASQRKPVPDLVAHSLDGKTWRLADHRGQVVLLNFWATWCPPCRRETPGLVRLAKSYSPNQLAVLGISMDDEGLDRVRQFVSQFKIPYAIAVPGNDFLPTSSLEALPTTLLIDKQRRLAKTYEGAVSESTFRADVDALLAE